MGDIDGNGCDDLLLDGVSPSSMAALLFQPPKGLIGPVVMAGVRWDAMVRLNDSSFAKGKTAMTNWDGRGGLDLVVALDGVDNAPDAIVVMTSGRRAVRKSSAFSAQAAWRC